MPMTIREAERILKESGSQEVKGSGKGSHRKFEKSGERPITLPSHGKELSRIVESSINKKTIKIPHWLNIRAEKAGINFSRTMTEALMEKLGV